LLFGDPQALANFFGRHRPAVLSSRIRHHDRCTYQAICVPICQTGAWLSTPPYKFDPSRCLESCRLCLNACPSQAIYGVFKKGEKLLEPQKK
jgi:ferredoxin